MGTQASALTGSAFFSLRAVPARRHPTGGRVYRAIPAEAPRPRCACGSRQEAAKGLSKAAAPLVFLLASEPLSCTTAAGPPLPCLCPVMAPEPQNQET